MEGLIISEVEEKGKGGSKPRWEYIVGLLTLLMIVFIVVSGLWYSSSWTSMRGYTQGVYSQTDDWAGVNQQYERMTASFNNNTTEYIYHIAGMSCAVNKDMVQGTAKDDYIKVVLDVYTANLYNLDTLSGVKADIHKVAGDQTHELYGAVMIVTGLVIFFVLRYLYLNYGFTDFLKQTGVSFLIAAIISFVLLIVLYTLLVGSWVQTDTRIYKEGLPIIAAMIKEFYTYYIAAIGTVGAVLCVPAVVQLLSKGKGGEGKKPEETEQK